MTDPLAFLYTPLEQAVSELHARRSANTVAPTDSLAAHLRSGSFAAIWRNIASPNFELARFASLATIAGLTPLVLEFHSDRFLTRNPLKCALARLRFSESYSASSFERASTLSIADLSASEGHAFRDLRTLWGQPLISFHRELLDAVPGLSGIQTLDISDWIRQRGPTARCNYTDFLSLFSDSAILFEDFLLTSHEQQFTSEVVIPSFEAASSRDGRRPLICRIDPTDGAGQLSWFHYPRELLPLITSRFPVRQLSDVAHDN